MTQTPLGGTEGRTALVTGGARGIGRAIADRLLADGTRLVLLDISYPHSPDDGMLRLTTDMTQPAWVEDAVRKKLATMGVLANCVTPAVVETDMLEQVTPQRVVVLRE